jgi:uncharacterized protein
MSNSCNQCGNPISHETRFCGNCGALADVTLVYHDPFKSKGLRLIFSYYGAVLLLCLIFEYLEPFDGLTGNLISDITFILITVFAAAFDYEELTPRLNILNIKLLPLVGVCLFSILFACAVNLSVPIVNRWLFDTDLNYYWLYADSSNPILFMFLSIAVMPAVFEELAFRGFILNNLTLFTNKQTALIISSFLFALLHLSFISFFWLFPFALVLGQLRLKYDTLWYGIVAHLMFNTTACIFSLYEANVLQ